MFGFNNHKSSGAIITDGHYSADTSQCIHCGQHFQITKGSKIKRGYCLKCTGVTCGKLECMECYPFEKRLDDAEKGKFKGAFL